jgi:uncharacterized protein
MNSAEEIIKRLELIPHPEGGYYRETYRSACAPTSGEQVSHLNRPRVWCTGIYYLLIPGAFSAFHKLWQDEMWHFYDGTPIRIHMISEDGSYCEVVAGGNFSKGEVPQVLIAGGTWFAAELSSHEGYGLAGCTVSPGFDFADFTLAERANLISLFPGHSELIARLTRV